jgi:DNA-binding transcriptional regulator YiaG
MQKTRFEDAAGELLPLVTDLGHRLGVQRRVPMDMQPVLDKVADRIPEPSNGSELSGIDPYLAESLAYGVMRCYRALMRPPAQARPELRIGLEHVRQALAYILEEVPTSDDRTPQEIASWLAGAVESRQSDIADVLGVSSRTLYRWATGTSTPAGPEAARLRLVARLVNNLRHAMTPAGAVLWLREPHRELGGGAPSSVLDTPDAYPVLVRLAARTRSHSAS